MTREIEEQILEEIEVIMFKFNRSLGNICEKYNDELDEADSINKQLDCNQEMIFQLRKCLDNTLINIKTIQEKYEKELQDE